MPEKLKWVGDLSREDANILEEFAYQNSVLDLTLSAKLWYSSMVCYYPRQITRHLAEQRLFLLLVRQQVICLTHLLGNGVLDDAEQKP